MRALGGRVRLALGWSELRWLGVTFFLAWQRFFLPARRLRDTKNGCQSCVRCSTPKKVVKTKHPKKAGKTETRTRNWWITKIEPYQLDCMALYNIRCILTYINVFTNDGPLMRMCPG